MLTYTRPKTRKIEGGIPVGATRSFTRSLIAAATIALLAIAAALPALAAGESEDPGPSDTDLQAVPPPGGRFFDDDGSIFEKAIEALATEGITQGCNPPYQTGFCPDDLVTRGHMAVFLVRAMGYTDDGGGDLFTDDDGTFYEKAADRLATAGVTAGCNPPDNDRFCGDQFVTRGQMAAFIVRAMKYSDNGGGDLFTDDDGTVFENAIDRLGTAGVTSGCNPPDNNRFCPDDNVTRGQMAAFLTRALGLSSSAVPARPQTLNGSQLGLEKAVKDKGCVETQLCVINQSPTGEFFVIVGWSHLDWSSASATDRDQFKSDGVRMEATFDGRPIELVQWPIMVDDEDTAVKAYSFQFPDWLDGPHVLEVTYIDDYEPSTWKIRDNLTLTGGGYELTGSFSLGSSGDRPNPETGFRIWP